MTVPRIERCTCFNLADESGGVKRTGKVGASGVGANASSNPYYGFTSTTHIRNRCSGRKRGLVPSPIALSTYIEENPSFGIIMYERSFAVHVKSALVRRLKGTRRKTARKGLREYFVVLLFLGLVVQGVLLSSNIRSAHAVTSLGTLYVSSTSGGTITRINLDTLTTQVILSGLPTPEGGVCGPDNRVYFTLSGLNGGTRAIIRFNQDGSGLTTVLNMSKVPALATSGGPEGPSFGPSGDLFFNTRASPLYSATGVWRIPGAVPGATPVQVILPFTTANGEATAFLTAGLFFGNVLAADFVNNRIVRVAPPFTFAQAAINFTTSTTTPNGLAVNSTASGLFVSESNTGLIKIFSPAGTFLGTFSTVPLGVRKIGFDAMNNLYAAIPGSSNQVIRIAQNGIQTVIAAVSDANGIAICPADFSLSLSPSSLVINQGASGTSTINLTSLGGFAGAVNLQTIASGYVGVGVNNVTNKIYVAGGAADNIKVFDGSTNAVVKDITVGHRPTAVAVNPNTNKIYVTNFGSGTVSVIDGSTNAVVANVTVPSGLGPQFGSGPDGVGVNPNTNEIYVANVGLGTVSVIDGSTNAVVANVMVGSSPEGVGVNPSTNKIYVANQGSDTVSVIDGSTNTVVATFIMGPASSSVRITPPSSLAVNPVNNRIYVAREEFGSVSVIDGGQNRIVANVTVGSNPTGVSANAATNRIYVANYGSSSVSVIDGSTNTVVANVGVGLGPDGAGVNVNTNRIYLANSPYAFGFPPGSVSVIDGVSSAVVATITGPTPSVSPSSVSLAAGGTATSTLTISTTVSTSTGNYTFRVFASSGSLFHLVDITVTVPPFDFSLSNSGGITVVQGSSGSNIITVNLVSGTTGPVTLSASGLPSGALASFSGGCTVTPSCPISPTLSVTLTITASSSTPTGSFTVTVNGTGGGQTRTTIFTLTVNPSGTVGGTEVPIDKLALLAPYLGLAGVIALVTVGASIFFRRFRPRKNEKRILSHTSPRAARV